jgi:hypothetical protein
MKVVAARANEATSARRVRIMFGLLAANSLSESAKTLVNDLGGAMTV